MRAYLTTDGVFVDGQDGAFLTGLDWNQLFTHPEPGKLAREAMSEGAQADLPQPKAPIDRQEVWAAGVTYLRSRAARMSESEKSRGGSFYDRVYSAERPEIFFKATAHRVSGPGEAVGIRSDSRWTVPEPELALAVSSHGAIIGFTIGNDMSARDIEGENPLYLPQAKIYRGSCALGPALFLASGPPPGETEIRLRISRGGRVVLEDAVHLSRMKRTAEELVDFLFRDNEFPHGCYLLTGTGIVPPDDFALEAGDEVSITMEPVGTLTNVVRGA